MIYGIGTDICSVARVVDILEKHGNKFVRRILTEEEISTAGDKINDPYFLARRFAGKEAVAKALRVGIGKKLSFLDVVFSSEHEGAPTVRLVGLPSSTFAHIRLHISFSDDADMAHAFAVAEQENKINS